MQQFVDFKDKDHQEEYDYHEEAAQYSSDCGLFAIANAIVCNCNGQKPES
jgi:hypothetical protein